MADVAEVTLDEALNEFRNNQSGFSESLDFYNANPRDLAIGLSTPVPMRELLAQVGVPRVYVDSLVERLLIEGFRAGDSNTLGDELWDWFKHNRLDHWSVLGFRDALVYGRSYITVSMPVVSEVPNPLVRQDVPVISVESPLALFAKVDPATRDVLWAVRSVQDSEGKDVAATLYLPDRTDFYGVDSEGRLVLVESFAHNLGIVPVVPVVNQLGPSDLYGSSMITPELRSITNAISRCLMNMQATSELMANPVRAIFGTTKDELLDEGQTALDLYTASFIVVEDSTGGMTQLPAAELRNYTDAIGQMMKMAASYTGLPPQYLSVESDNPASAEAIRAAETRLVKTCETLVQGFGEAWELAMQVAWLVAGKSVSDELLRLESVWRDPATPTFQAKADATTKLFSAGVITKKQARLDMGYSPEQIVQMEEEDALSPLSQLGALYGSGLSESTGVGGGSGEEGPAGVSSGVVDDGGV